MSKPKTREGDQVFRVELRDTKLSREEAEHVADAIRNAITRELVKLDFRIEELKPLSRASGGGCGGACNACSQAEL